MNKPRNNIRQVEESMKGLLIDINTAQIDGETFIVANNGSIYDFPDLDELAQRATFLLAVIEHLRATYDVSELRSFAEVMQRERLAMIAEKDELARLRYLAKGRKANAETRIYLMQNQRNGYYKIGRAKNPAYREATLQAEEPEISLIAHYPATVKDEKALHNLFAAKRIRGEWFNLSADEVAQFHQYFQ